jgi:predicted XRE-type DNA-binding protein
MEQLLIEQVEKKLKAMGMKMTQLSAELGIPYQRMAKWVQRKSAPKGEDAIILTEWLKGDPVKQLRVAPPVELEALVAVLHAKVSEMLADKSGRSSLVEHESITRDAQELTKIRS